MIKSAIAITLIVVAGAASAASPSAAQKPVSPAKQELVQKVLQLWQVDDAPTYDVAFFRSYSGSFWNWLTESAGEYGYRYETLRG